jgi:3-oxoacyl-[acyl-carrier-protein] synthase-3
MDNTNKRMGIINFATYIPIHEMQISSIDCFSENLCSEIGVLKKPVSLEDCPSSMGLQSVKQLLQKIEINPIKIKTIIYGSSGIFSKRFWSPASMIQQEIGAINAFSFEINNGCNAGNLGLKIAKNMANDILDDQYVLIVLSDALSTLVDHANPENISLFNFSDAATAILIGKAQPKYQIIDTHFNTESQYFNYLYIPKNENKIIYAEKDKFKSSLKESYLKNYNDLSAKILKENNLSIFDIKYIFLNQGDHKIFEKLANQWGITQSKFIRSHYDYGHMGNSDIYHNLESIENDGLLDSGDYLLFISSAIGFSWSVALIKVL